MSASQACGFEPAGHSVLANEDCSRGFLVVEESEGEGNDGTPEGQAARKMTAEAKKVVARMEENHRASFGLLERARTCRWRDGITLKRDMPGTTSGWMIAALGIGVSGGDAKRKEGVGFVN